MACKQGIRQHLVDAKRFYEEQKKYDPHRELWHSIVYQVHRTPGGYESLSPDQQLYYCVTILDGEVYNGGMHQFFSNSSGKHYYEVLRGLQYFDAKESMELLLRAKHILFGEMDPPEDNNDRWDAMKQYSGKDDEEEADWSIEIENINRQYWKTQDRLLEKLQLFAIEKHLIDPFLK